MQIIMLIGEPDCGKTTTCRLLYHELKDWSTIYKSTYKKEGGDFSCSLNFNYKKIAIKSAGDSRYRIQSAIDKYSEENFDVLVCTCRANFTDMIEYAEQKSNGNFREICKIKIDNKEEAEIQNKTDINEIINILKKK